MKPLENNVIPATTTLTAPAEDPPVDQGAAYDAIFVGRLRSGDPEAFDTLVALEGPRITRLVSRLLGWNNDCADVVQDVFVDAWQSIKRFRGDSDIGTWLYAIAVNRCRNHRRSQQIWKACFRKLCSLSVTDSQPKQSKQDSPDVEDIHRALQELAHHDRELIVLVCLEQTTLDRASKLLGLRKNTAEVRLHRARQRLKRILRLENHD